MNETPNRARAGYTIAEVLVAVMIVAIVAIACCGALSSGFCMVESSRQDLRATQILMQKLEAMRLCTWSQLTSFSFREPYDPMGVTNGTAGVMYAGNVVVSQATNIPNTVSYFGDVRLVTVNLTWTNSDSSRPIAHRRQMQTQVARNGLQNYIWGMME